MTDRPTANPHLKRRQSSASVLPPEYDGWLNPLAAPIDRALLSTVPHFDRARIRDAILAEIEAEYGPIKVERSDDPVWGETRIASEWRAEADDE